MDDTMMWILVAAFIALIGGAVALLFVLGGASGLAEYIEKWCLDNPGICGVTDENSLNYQIADNSADALACAINSVSLGQKKTDGCEEYLKKITGSGGIIESPFKTIGGSTGNVIMGSDYRNLMEELDFSDAKTPGIHTGPAGFQYNDFITGMATGHELGLEVPQVECTGSGDDIKCTVSGFNIPENYNNWFGDAKQVVGGFGDPSMIIYYTKFPAGEDGDWTDWTPWFRSLSGVVLLSACAGRIVGIAANALSKTTRVAKGFITSATSGFKKVSKLLPKGTATKLEEITAKISKTKVVPKILGGVREIKDATHVMLADDIVKNALREGRTLEGGFARYLDDVADLGKLDDAAKAELKGAFTTVSWASTTGDVTQDVIDASRILNNNIGESGFKRILIDIYNLKPDQVDEMIKNANLILTNPSIKARIFGQSAAGMGSWFASYLDSAIGKFVNEFPNSLVLHVALRPDLRKTYPLDIPTVNPDSSENRSVDVSYGMPVMLDRSFLTQGGIVHFYSASPCKADIEVMKGNVVCDNFIYEKESSLAMCENDEGSGIIKGIKEIFTSEHDCNSVKEIFSERESRLDVVAAQLASSMNSIPVYVNGERYDEIYYPLLRPGIAHENGYLYFKFDREKGDVVSVFANIGNTPDDNDAPMSGAKEHDIDNIRVDSGKGFRLGYWKGEECVVSDILNKPERTLRIASDDGCHLFTATKDNQDPDMGIVEGDTVIRCDFDGTDGGGTGFLFQDYCAITGSLGTCKQIETNMTFYYSITASGSPDEFIGVRIQQSYRSDEREEKAGRLMLIDSIESVSDRRDGKIDTVAYALGKTKFSFSQFILNVPASDVPIGYEGEWSATFYDTDGDGIPDNIHNMGCSTPAILLKVDRGGSENDDSEGNNYCIKEQYRSTLGSAIGIGGAVLSVATAFMKTSVIASWIGFGVDCILGLADVVASNHTWPSGKITPFKPSFL